MTEESLREIVATLNKTDPGGIAPASPLGGALAGSLGRARLDANLRSKYGVANPAVYSAKTFGDLCRVLGVAIDGNGAARAAQHIPAAHSAPPAPVNSLAQRPVAVSIGADVEAIAAMPSAADYWEDEFYKTTFTPREIAYAVQQSSPQASFAAMWCAKEAARKADASLAQLDWQSLEVVHDAGGKPTMHVREAEALGALSLSHTDQIAFAVFALAPGAGAAASGAGTLEADAQTDPRSHGQRGAAPNRRSSGSVAMIAVLALLLSVAALVLALLRH